MINQDPKRLAELLSVHADGMLDDAQQQELFALLNEDADAREAYIDQMMFHAAMLRKAGGRGELTPLINMQVENEEADQTHNILPLLDGGVPSEASPILGFFGSTIQRGIETLPGFVPIMGLVSVVSVVATLVLVAVVPWPSENEPASVAVTFTAQSSHEPSSAATDRPVRSLRTPATVAQITRVVNAKWSERSWRPLGLDHLSVGRRLELESGLAEIKYNTGACVILRGPAIFNLVAENAGLLNAGQLTANVPETAIGFTIETPQGNIVDFGTEFGVEVDEASAVDVHVFQGEVEVELADNQNGGDEKISLLEKQALSIDTSTLQVKKLVSHPEHFVRTIGEDSGEKDASERFTRDDFEKDTSSRYAGSNSYGGGGSFKINPDGRGVLEITTGDTNTYSVVSKQPLLGVGESFSAKVPAKTSRQGVFLVVSTVAAEPNGGMGGSFGLRFRRDERGLLVHHYGAVRASNLMRETLTTDPDQSAPIKLSIERISPTEFKFYYDTGSGPVPLTAEPIVNKGLGACDRLHVGVEAWGNKGDLFQFDNLRIKPIHPQEASAL